MRDINRVGDPNDAGGNVTSSLQTGLRINGNAISVDGSPVASHAPCPVPAIHCNAVTANGNTNFRINGTAVNANGDADTCGHVRAATVNFRIT